MIVLRGSKGKNGNIVSEVVKSPEKYPVIFLISYMEVFSIKDIDVGKPITIGEGEFIVIRKLFEFI
jgi:hypothetical protein